MQLGISAEAAPGATLAELAQACTQRGLDAVEVRASASCVADEALDVRIVGVYCDDAEVTEAVMACGAAPGNGPLVLGGTQALDTRIAAARALRAQGVDAAVVVTGPADAWMEPVRAGDCPYVWQVDESCADPAGDAARIFDTVALPRYIRLLGGGPEAAMHEGRGIGALIGSLAFRGYDGAVILAPSSPRFHVAWSTWLGRRGGWGCGSKADGPLALQRVRRGGE